MRNYSKMLFSKISPIVLIGAVIAGIVLLVSPQQESLVNAQNESTQQLQLLGSTFRNAAKKIGPAVVFISTVQTVEGADQLSQLFGDEFFRRFFGAPQPRKEFKRRGLGSGCIIDHEGHILTNNHVVADADEITVTLPDKREFGATIVGIDPKSDVAIIQIEGKDLPVATLGDSGLLDVGDWVLAVGTPYGLSQTVTAGIVSAEGRANIGIVDYEDFIQTDAAINPGNSGGPLINLNGEVIGINTAIFSQSGGYQGIGFAIPINMAKGIMDSLIEHGRMIRGWLGVIIQPVTEEIAKSFELDTPDGVLIGDVVADGPAAQAGFQRGDIVRTFDGQAVDDPNTLRNIVAQTDVGKTVPVEIVRDGKRETIQVTIGEQPSEETARVGSAQQQPETARFGVRVQELTPDIAKQLGYEGENGVIVANVEAGSPAAETGLRRGDLIQEINRQPIRSVSDYANALDAIERGKGFIALVRRGQNTFYAVVNAE